MKRRLGLTTVGALVMVTLMAFGFGASANASVLFEGGTGPQIDPRKYLATIYYDGKDHEQDERSFPILGDNDNLISSSGQYRNHNTEVKGGQGEKDPEPEYQQDKRLNVEDDSEMYVPRQITAAASGYPWEQQDTRAYQILSGDPTNQTPAVYFHRVVISSKREVWEYWLYYAVNPTSAGEYPAHEHDWESYWIYLERDVYGQMRPVGVRLSGHNFNSHCLPWSTFQPHVENGQYVCRIEDGTHIVISCEGDEKGAGRTGSHALYAPVDDLYGTDRTASKETQDGVCIKWDGHISQRGGSLVAGSQTKQEWLVVTSALYDPNTLSDRRFVADNSKAYYRGDYEIQEKNTIGHTAGGFIKAGFTWWPFNADPRELPETLKTSDMKAPWERDEWKNPPWWTSDGGGGAA